jgi:Flp pilus assembly protein TadG
LELGLKIFNRRAKKIKGNSSIERGQALVEFALIFPIIIAIVMALTEFGVYFMTYHTVQNASREAARAATTYQDLQEDDTRVVSYVDTLIPVSGPLAGFNGNTTNNAITDCDITDQVTVIVTGTYNFVALNVLGLNGVDMTVPTTMHYELCESYTYQGAPDTATPFPTNTPGPSPTSTSSPLPTSELCPVIGSAIDYDGDDIRWWLTNTGVNTERVNRVYFEWIDTPSSQYFSHLNFGNQRIHDGNDSSPNTDLTGGWVGFSSRRDLPGGFTKQLNIDFNSSHPSNGIDITVYFESGCSINLSSGISTPTLTITPTASDTPSASPTASNTPTPSNTPDPSASPTASSCSISGGTLSSSGWYVYWPLTNNGTSTERISRIYFDWVDSPSSQYVYDVWFDGSRIHTGGDTSPPTDLTSGWLGSASLRDLGASQTNTLTLEFYSNHGTGGIDIIVEFESGCTVNLSGPPTATPTPANSPTPTNTPDPSVSPTVTPTSGCSISGGTLSASGWYVYWPITNNGASTERISRVYFEWVDSPSSQYVYDVWFGGPKIHSGGDTSPPTDLTSGWVGDSTRRDLAATQSKTLTLEFYSNHGTSGIDILVEFESGCSVSLFAPPTATPSPTPANSPTNTLTPSPTLTPSQTNTPGCAVSGGSLTINNDKLYWTLINGDISDEIISNVNIDWQDIPGDQHLDRLKLDGDEIYHQHDTTPPTYISSGWNAEEDRRILEGSSIEILEVDFNKDLFADVAITVIFESGCSVNGIIAPPTATSSPTPTSLPSATPTASLTPTASCSVSTGSLNLTDPKKLRWTLTNNATNDVSITAITIDWQDIPSDQKLKKIRLDGDEIWDNEDTSPPTSISSGWHSDADRRILDATSSEVLEFEFDKELYPFDITVSVTFDVGCSVNGGIGAPTATSTPACLVSSGSMWISGDDFYWNLVNVANNDVTIVQITVEWDEDEAEELKKVRLDGDEIWNVGDSSSPTNITGNWHSDANRRALDENSIETLRIEFEEDLDPPITIVLVFDAGCGVKGALP